MSCCHFSSAPMSISRNCTCSDRRSLSVLFLLVLLIVGMAWHGGARASGTAGAARATLAADAAGVNSHTIPRAATFPEGLFQKRPIQDRPFRCSLHPSNSIRIPLSGRHPMFGLGAHCFPCLRVSNRILLLQLLDWSSLESVHVLCLLLRGVCRMPSLPRLARVYLLQSRVQKAPLCELCIVMAGASDCALSSCGTGLLCAFDAMGWDAM